jgi:hypothetical protein
MTKFVHAKDSAWNTSYWWFSLRILNNEYTLEWLILLSFLRKEDEEVEEVNTTDKVNKYLLFKVYLLLFMGFVITQSVDIFMSVCFFKMKNEDMNTQYCKHSIIECHDLSIVYIDGTKSNAINDRNNIVLSFAIADESNSQTWKISIDEHSNSSKVTKKK